MNRLKPEKQRQIVAALVEGNSIRSTCRMTNTAKGTVLKLLVDIGKVCSEYQNQVFINLDCNHIQCDEIWSFCYAKEKNVPKNKKDKFGYGDIYTYTSLCEETKLVPSCLIDKRDLENATIFMKDLASRLKNRIQLTTDGFIIYVDAVERAFGADVDFSQLIKIYNNDGLEVKETRYSTVQCVGTKKARVNGKPR